MSRAYDLPISLLSVPQVANILNVSTRTVRRILGRELQFHRVASVIRISQQDLSAYIRSIRQ